MRLNYIEIENYKSFWKNQKILLEPGFNIFLGANNSGKTTALEVIDLNPNANEPHKSIRNLTHYGDIELNRSVFKASISTNIDELKKIAGNPVYLPSIPHISAEAAHKIFFESIVSGLEFELLLELKNDQYVTFKYPEGLSQQSASNADQAIFGFSLNYNTNEKPVFTAPTNWVVGRSIANYYRGYIPFIYRFNADRRPASTSGTSDARLARDASNLPYCLNYLQSNDAHGHKILCQWINKVFPSVQWVQSIPLPGTGNFELRCLPLDPESRRDDLAVPLSRMGSGIGNVIAMFYVVLTSRQPQVIAIDEPNSFLHPRALRELLQILSTEAKQHQIILTAHSADVLTAIKPSLITMFEFDGATTSVNQVDAAKLSSLRTELSDLGIRMTDLHGRDRVLWVEGQTEELVMPELLKVFCPEIAAGTAVLRVEHTGTFDKKGVNPTEVASVYTRLTSSSALVPPMTAILLDREQHKHSECVRLEKESGDTLKFLERRMLENYVLFSEPIASILNALGEVVTIEQINALLVKNGITDTTDLTTVDGAKVLSSIFSEASEARHEFKKVRDVSELISFLVENEHDKIMPLGDFLRRLFKLT